jgi:signal-transduction protein with cAMP-binding, CBS, and nucleotidyltransferase domain
MLAITEIWKTRLLNNLSLHSGQINYQFPFLTFNDDKYSEFMTLIMQNLEVRLFKKGEMIYKELDECTEVLFVFSGRYNVGYELNKIRRYRK